MIPRSLKIALMVTVIAIAAAGTYVIRLRQIEADRINRRTGARPISAPVEGRAFSAVLYVAYDEDGQLRRQETSVALPEDPAGKTREILRTLISSYVSKDPPHQLGDGADVRDVFFVNEQFLVVDLNAAFADEHPSSILAESLTIKSLLATITANAPAAKRVQFLVEGRERETLAGHLDLSATYDLSSLDPTVLAQQ